MILDKIVAAKRKEIESGIGMITEAEFIKTVEKSRERDTLDLYSAITKSDEISIIAEIKRGSPSEGIIRADFNCLEIANEYQNAEVSAISVLTERTFFKGSKNYLYEVKKISDIPVLRKDFIIDKRQVYESYLLGADAIVLIAALLDLETLKEFNNIAKDLGLSCLVEVNNKEELEKVLLLDCNIVGINNRDFKTFEVDLKKTEELKKDIPKGIAVVSEGGISTYSDMKYLKDIKVNAALIGEALMKAKNIEEKIKEFKGED